MILVTGGFIGSEVVRQLLAAGRKVRVVDKLSKPSSRAPAGCDLKKVLDGQHPLEILGDGQQTRCFTHVRDIAHGILLALDRPRAVDEDFNLSSTGGRTSS
jgi:nucleoside-diphosphate-sugar epimerase